MRLHSDFKSGLSSGGCARGLSSAHFLKMSQAWAELASSRLCQRTTDACLGPHLSSRISHATLNHTRNVSNRGAVVQYAECSYTTCRFQVMHGSTRKQLIRKRLRSLFGAITYQSYLASSSNTENRHLQE